MLTPSPPLDLPYLQDLTLALRRRGVAEAQVSSAVADVLGATRTTDRSPTELFGAAVDHARTVAGGATVPTGLRVDRAGRGTALLLVVVAVWRGPTVELLVVAAVVALVTFLCGRSIDRALP